MDVETGVADGLRIPPLPEGGGGAWLLWRVGRVAAALKLLVSEQPPTPPHATQAYQQAQQQQN